ncbi:hypothetical protein [Pseudanabaena sp. PCC 6802]|uniref:hypothetical protein n=1 Tax=Pseudanabaena sp. PCC 6802 TaxID=118173 RepID=UPI0003482668|nr:hypothetical protein [Pseudanabaena sp. PCC 6802]
MSSALDDIRKRELRWTFCLALRNGRDIGVSEKVFRAIARDMKSGLSDNEVREMVQYLASAGYCTLETLIDESVLAVRTNKLTDLVEYNCEAPPSIARPAKNWGLV